MIYNPYFEQAGVDAVVVPMGCQAGDYPVLLKSVFTLTNIRGALITMPHKVMTVGLLDGATPTVRILGACNAVRRMQDGPSSCVACSISMSSPAHAVTADCGSSQPSRTRPW